MRFVASYIYSVVDVGVAWFPQQYSEVFYVLKGLLALVSTLMLIFHMTRVWWKINTLGQQLRYLTLLALSVLITGGSAEQLRDGEIVNYRNLGAFLITVMLIVTMVISIREDRER